MKAEDKAKELYSKFRGYNNETEQINKTTAKQLSDELATEMVKEWDYIESEDIPLKFIVYKMAFWEEVQRQIKLL